MDYNKIVLDNYEDKKLLHAVAVMIKKEYAILAKALAQGEIGSAALVAGSMERDVNLLADIDKKMNDIKETVNVA